jgi:hypothetical protein
VTINITRASDLAPTATPWPPPARSTAPAIPLCLGCLGHSLTPDERPAAALAVPATAPTLPMAAPAPKVPYSGPTRAVVVRPHGDPRAAQWEQQCLAYVERHELRLVGIADADGAMRMVLAGEADVLVAAKNTHVVLPAYVRLLSDEWAGNDVRGHGDVSPSLRRPQRVSRISANGRLANGYDGRGGRA